MNKSGTVVRALTILVLMFCACAWSSCSVAGCAITRVSSTPTSTAVPELTSTSTHVQEQQTGAADGPVLFGGDPLYYCMSQQQSDLTYHWWHTVIGEVQNSGDVPVYNVTVVVTFQFEDRVETVKAPAMLTMLNPHQVSPFEVKLISKGWGIDNTQPTGCPAKISMSIEQGDLRAPSVLSHQFEISAGEPEQCDMEQAMKEKYPSLQFPEYRGVLLPCRNVDIRNPLNSTQRNVKLVSWAHNADGQLVMATVSTPSSMPPHQTWHSKTLLLSDLLNFYNAQGAYLKTSKLISPNWDRAVLPSQQVEQWGKWDISDTTYSVEGELE